jgi:hypothetical protein
MNQSVRNLILLLVPTLILTGWALYVAGLRTEQPTLRIAITGYDPRDLLRGHYVNFRLDLTGSGPSPECACLRPDPAAPLRPVIEAAKCLKPPPAAQCPHFLTDPRRTFRYYAGQEQALELEKQLRAAPGSVSVTAHFDGKGGASFSDVRVEK